MTTATPQIYGEFGQTLAFAERTLSAVLREHLAERDTMPEQWYALKLLAGAGEAGWSRDELIQRLSTSPTFSAGAADELLGHLEADGLVTNEDGCVTLTVAGTAAFEDLRAYVAGPSVALLGQFDVHDIETTVRTLQAITQRAAAAAAAA
jgi:hypothetical protein